MPFYAIAAMSENRVIGNHGKIPWHLPEEFRWFKHKTMGGTLIMGRKTFESIGKPLPGRKTIILSRQPNPIFSLPTYTFKTLYEYVNTHLEEQYWVAGGSEVYGEFLDHCHYIYLTIVKKQIAGDALFPSQGHLQTNHLLDQIIHENADFRVERWKYKNPVFNTLPPETWPFPERTS